jgi:hypothetical protein
VKVRTSSLLSEQIALRGRTQEIHLIIKHYK